MNDSRIPKHKGIERLIKTTGWSLQGLAATWREEAAFRQESVLALVLVPLSFLMSLPLWLHLMMIGSLVTVLVAELINSAIESTIDRISHERHPLSKQAKDMGGAAVLLCLVWAATIWIVGAYHHFTHG